MQNVGKMNLTEGVKHDAEKPRWDLIPYKALEQVVLALNHGARKYGDDNWRKVPDAKRRYFAALMRHIVAWWCGEECDKESGLSHLAHAGACLLFLLDGGENA